METIIKGHTVKQEGDTVRVTPGLTLFRGVPNKEDVWTELSETDAIGRFHQLVRRIENIPTESEV
jgi:hypothetical protein